MSELQFFGHIIDNEEVDSIDGKRFDVWLAKGKTFQGVGVEWADKSGKWHAH